MKRNVTRTAGIAAATLGMGLLALPFAAGASATQPDPEHKVTICHRTNSVTNPYVVETVDEASVNSDSGDDHGQGDHHIHTGPVFDSGTEYPAPHNGDQWGDIIPPFYADGVTPGYWDTLNWNEAGQAIFANDCNLVVASETPTDEPTTPTDEPTDPVTETPTDNPTTPTDEPTDGSTDEPTDAPSSTSSELPAVIPSTGGNEGELAHTGSTSGVLLGLGAALLATGAVFVAASRRRPTHS